MPRFILRGSATPADDFKVWWGQQESGGWDTRLFAVLPTEPNKISSLFPSILARETGHLP